MSKERSDFLVEMQDVMPISCEKETSLVRAKPPEETLQIRRRAASLVNEIEPDALSSAHIEPVDPHDVLNFKRGGVQHGVYKNLRLGKYVIDARLDLHHRTVEQARSSVNQFVHDCLAHNIRCALITHGKGEGREHPALLKSCVAHWLPQFKEVLAFHSAQRHHGGTGATYILLRKSEKKKQENWEAHQKKS